MPLGKNKLIPEWEKILLDTGIVLALFAAQRGSQDPQILFVDKLIKFLCNQGTGDGKKRIFYISTITLGEIITKESGSDKIRRVLKVLDSDNVEFLSFDTDTALEFNIRMQPFIEKDELHKKAKELGFSSQDYGMARQWISKDYMIAMTGLVKKVDVVLTLDKKTFYPICESFGETHCILAYPDLFDYADISVLKYHFDKIPVFLKKK